MLVASSFRKLGWAHLLLLLLSPALHILEQLPATSHPRVPVGSETPELRARVALDSPGHGPSTPAAEQSLHAEHSAERRPNGATGGGADHASQPVEEVRAGAALPASGEREPSVVLLLHVGPFQASTRV